jgi:conjugal transfer pilus assembly protein TraK
MFKRNLPQNLSATVAIIALSSFSLGAIAQEESLVSVADLPGVPVSITEHRRQPATKPINEASTQKAQADARIEKSEREAAIEEMKSQVAALQSGNGQNVRGSQATKDISDRLEKEIRENQQTERQEVAVLKPGVNRIIQISRGHPNRLVAPFSNPEVRTTNTDAEITTSGEIIYVATGSEQPVTLFISPKGNERMAASITLLPKAIPPQEIRFTLDAGKELIKYANPTAEQWETRTSYVDTITQAFRALALQNLPQGYTMRTPSQEDYVSCYAGKHVSFEIGQVVEGHNMEIQVAVATNNGPQPIEIIGHQCAGGRVLAAAEWPRSILEPGQKTEIFIAVQRLEDAEPDIRRPSLIQE